MQKGAFGWRTGIKSKKTASQTSLGLGILWVSLPQVCDVALRSTQVMLIFWSSNLTLKVKESQDLSYSRVSMQTSLIT